MATRKQKKGSEVMESREAMTATAMKSAKPPSSEVTTLTPGEVKRESVKAMAIVMMADTQKASGTRLSGYYYFSNSHVQGHMMTYLSTSTNHSQKQFDRLN